MAHKNGYGTRFLHKNDYTATRISAAHMAAHTEFFMKTIDSLLFPTAPGGIRLRDQQAPTH